MEVLPQRSTVTCDNMRDLKPWMGQNSGSSVKPEGRPSMSQWSVKPTLTTGEQLRCRIITFYTPAATSENDDSIGTNRSPHRYTRTTNAKFS